MRTLLLLDDTCYPNGCELPELGDGRRILVSVEVGSELLPGRDIEQAELCLELPGITGEVAEHGPVSQPRYSKVRFRQLRAALDLDSLRLESLDEVRQTRVR
jgi:hypothetical protein